MSETGQGSSGIGLPRWALFFMVPGVAAPVLILGFILRNEYAFDESRCPFEDGELRELSDDVAVQEQVRRCLDGVEERRYVIVRGGERKVLGRRRFAAEAFAEGYGFDGGISDAGEVSIVVQNPGHADQPFREGTPADEQQ